MDKKEAVQPYLSLSLLHRKRLYATVSGDLFHSFSFFLGHSFTMEWKYMYGIYVFVPVSVMYIDDDKCVILVRWVAVDGGGA